ncbi:MAG: YhcH/YjgK/YiaL family protein [Candidatus Atribacteria bacterium]|nr:YhcH/YjgK/YiaL family protein [Candidatus Atribacteria bacterium]
MILDKIENIQFYNGIGVRLKQAFEYITATDFSEMTSGRHEINAEMFVLVNDYITKTDIAKVLEAHKKYIDVQYLLKGKELIEYESYDNHLISQAYDEVNDYLLYKPYGTSKLKFTEGMVAVFFPEDLHMPGIIDGNPCSIKKIVVKVLIN